MNSERKGAGSRRARAPALCRHRLSAARRAGPGEAARGLFDPLQAGASGFLLKNAPPEDLIAAVRIVAAGNALLAPSVTRRIVADYANRPPTAVDSAAIGQLTELELEVLRLLATGKSNAELAAELYVGEGTIKTHVSHLLTKLGLRDRVQAVVFAYETGAVQPGSRETG